MNYGRVISSFKDLYNPKLLSFKATVTYDYPSLLKKSEYFILLLDDDLKLSIDGDDLLLESCISIYTST